MFENRIVDATFTAVSGKELKCLNSAGGSTQRVRAFGFLDYARTLLLFRLFVSPIAISKSETQLADKSGRLAKLSAATKVDWIRPSYIVLPATGEDKGGGNQKKRKGSTT